LEGYYFFEAEMPRTLSNLAADAIEQARYLTKELGVGVLADELALEFDDISSRVGQAVEEDLVSAETASAIRTLNGVLQAMSGQANERLWSIAGLQSPEWDVVRRHARAALDLYNADLSARRGEQAVDMPPAPDLYLLASAVDSKASFLAFVLALAADREDEERKERIHPSSPYGPGANGWENGRIETFLDAAAAWGGATSAITGEPMLSDAPSWRSFALFLLAGKHYE
jgi:hypothetical protein